jgi:hypothetical protein
MSQENSGVRICGVGIGNRSVNPEVPKKEPSPFSKVESLGVASAICISGARPLNVLFGPRIIPKFVSSE